MANTKTRASLFLLAGVALAAPAGAADLTAKAPPPAAPPVFTWTGLYVGMNAGYTFTASDPINVTTVNVADQTNFGPTSALGATGTLRARLDGFFFGGQLGYNWQISDRFILGVEADIQGAGVRGGNWQGSVWPTSAPGGYAATSVKAARQLEYLGTARARVGYAVTPTLMTYVTGGFAYGGANLSGTVSQALRPSLLQTDTVRADHYDILTGWTAGAGAEMALSRNISAKLDYLYYDLGELWLNNVSLSPRDILTGARPLTDLSAAHTRYAGHLVRVGLNYRFDGTIPETSGSAATPLFAATRFAAVEKPGYDGWRAKVMPYAWIVNLNGGVTLADRPLGVDATMIDLLTRSAAFPLAFNGRAEISNGPFFAYGDLAWARLRFAGSTLSLRSPIQDAAIAASALGRLRLTMAIGEAGFGYELARWKLTNAPGSFTAIDGYVGLRYVNIGLNLAGDVAYAVSVPPLDYQRVGGRNLIGGATLWWMDPVIGMRMRHSFSPGSQFEARADIGGFGAGSKFSWQFFGGYHHDFEVKGVRLTGLLGYRALGVDYSKWVEAKESGINAVVHGPVMGVGMKF